MKTIKILIIGGCLESSDCGIPITKTYPIILCRKLSDEGLTCKLKIITPDNGRISELTEDYTIIIYRISSIRLLQTYKLFPKFKCKYTSWFQYLFPDKKRFMEDYRYILEQAKIKGKYVFIVPPLSVLRSPLKNRFLNFLTNDIFEKLPCPTMIDKFHPIANFHLSLGNSIAELFLKRQKFS